MNIEKRAVTELVHAHYNPRKKLTPADTEFQKIQRSLQEFGYVDPIIINSDNTIIGGHQRATVLQSLGYKEIDVVVVDMDKTKEKALNVALNKISGEWDFEKLEVLLEELQLEMDATITGFDDEDIQRMLADLQQEIEVIEDDYDVEQAIEEITEPKTKPGEIWQLGEHRLMCGSSTDEADTEKLMGKGMADLLLTDPPYNSAYTGKTKDALKIQNDSMKDDEFKKFLLEFYKNAHKAMKPGAPFYIWHADNEGLNFRAMLQEAGMQLRQTLIWNKNAITLGRQDYQWKHEPCLYGWKEGAAHKWYSDRSQPTVMDFKKPSRSEQHPTMKPIELFSYQISNSSKPGDIVLDMFGGSGTTMMACEQLNRTCYMMELDPKYCDVIINRWEQFTGQKAVKIA